MALVNLAALLLFAAVGAWQAARFKRRLNAPDVDGECISCQSTALDVLGPDAYRCRDCGYEGGAGLAAIAERNAAAAFAGRDPAERQQVALQRLHDALHSLMGAPSSATDRDATQEHFAAVERAALAGAKELDDAGRAAGGPVDVPGFGRFDPAPMAAELRGLSQHEAQGIGAQGIGWVDDKRGAAMAATVQQIQAALASTLAAAPHPTAPAPRRASPYAP